MTTQTLTLAEFLLARILEDEAAVEIRAGIGVDYWTDTRNRKLASESAGPACWPSATPSGGSLSHSPTRSLMTTVTAAR